MTDNSTVDSEEPNPGNDPIEAVAVSVPERVNLNEFQQNPLLRLHEIAQELDLRVAGIRSRHQLVFEILKYYGSRGTVIEAEGYLDYSGDNFGFLRWPAFSFASNADDVYLAVRLIKNHDLRGGQWIKCLVRPPREKEKFLTVEEVLDYVEYDVEHLLGKMRMDVEWAASRGRGGGRRPGGGPRGHVLHRRQERAGQERMILESTAAKSPSPRVIDLVAPLGKGQRGLIVAPPRGGKTILLKNIAISIRENNPEVELIVLLLDERPEEVTDFRETVEASVYSSTFDESANRHIEVADTFWLRHAISLASVPLPVATRNR